MKIAFFSIIALFFAASSGALASTATANVKITTLSLTDTGNLLVQTTPRHTLDAGCTTDFWLVLATSTPNFDALLSMLITAQSRGSSVTVTATGVGNQFCNLSRVVLDE